MVPLYFLDRNAVVLIKRSNSGRVEKDQKKINLLRSISALDKRGNHVTPLLSIIEGEKGRMSSLEEIRDCVLKESDVVKKFFRVATTDSDQLIENADLFAATLLNFKEADWDRRGALLEDARSLFEHGGQISSAKVAAVEASILQLAEKNEVASDDPITILLLAALYRCDAARGALKLSGKWDGPHNPLSDVHAISRMAYIHAIGISVARNVYPVFVSGDEDISFIMKNVVIKNSELTSEGGLSMKIGYKKALFPALTLADYHKLMARLQSQPRSLQDDDCP